MFELDMFEEIPRAFNMTYRCFSVAMLPGNDRQHVERGGKIIMPPSALEQLTQLNIEFPMIFKLTNKKTNMITHCGVLEFVADEGKVYLPHWGTLLIGPMGDEAERSSNGPETSIGWPPTVEPMMMTNLVLEESAPLQIESVSLPVATFSKFQPFSEEFLDITNHKAVLENCLSHFSCLTTGDVIPIHYNCKQYELCVLETKPEHAVLIIECDMNVEFAPPVGYKGERRPQAEGAKEREPAEPQGFVPFQGEGHRLDGRKSEAESQPPTPTQPYVRGIPDYNWEVGTLSFIRNSRPPSAKEKEDTPSEAFQPFQGEGFTLRNSKHHTSP